jgi:hypothetical protein
LKVSQNLRLQQKKREQTGEEIRDDETNNKKQSKDLDILDMDPLPPYL